MKKEIKNEIDRIMRMVQAQIEEIYEMTEGKMAVKDIPHVVRCAAEMVERHVTVKPAPRPKREYTIQSTAFLVGPDGTGKAIGMIVEKDKTPRELTAWVDENLVVTVRFNDSKEIHEGATIAEAVQKALDFEDANA